MTVDITISGGIADTHINVTVDGAALVEDVTALDLGTGLSGTDNGDGSVTASVDESDFSTISPDSDADAHHAKTTSASELTDVSADSVSSAHHAKTSSASELSDVSPDVEASLGGNPPNATNYTEGTIIRDSDSPGAIWHIYNDQSADGYRRLDPGSENNPVSADVTDIAYQGPRADRALIGITSDWHWASSARDNDIVGLSTLKSNLDTVADTFNTRDVDAIFVLGDQVDRTFASNMSELVQGHQDATDYFKNQAGSGGSGVNAPVYWILGDHANSQAGSGDTDDVRAVYGWSSFDEGYYAKYIRGVKYIFLDTGSKGDTDADGTTVPTDMTQAQVDWLSTELDDAEQTSTPVVVVSHKPIGKGPGRPSKDRAIGEEEALEAIGDCPMVQCCLHGHAHHTDSWDRVKAYQDKNGVTWLSSSPPNTMMGDTSLVPHITMTANPGGEFAAVAEYDTQKFQTQFNLKDDHRISRTQRLFWSPSAIHDFSFFHSLDGWYRRQSGGTRSIVSNPNAFRVQVGSAESNETNALRRRFSTQFLSFDAPVSMIIQLEVVAGAGTGELSELVIGNRADQGDYLGFRLNDGSFEIDSKSGGSSPSAGFPQITSYSNGTFLQCGLRVDPGQYIEAFDMSGNFKTLAIVSDSNAIPSGDFSNQTVVEWLCASGSSDLDLELKELRIYRGYVGESGQHQEPVNP